MLELTGIAWEHPRATGPLGALAHRFLAETGVQVRWDTRSLAGFEEAPIDELAEAYDVIAIDHPFMGTAFASGALLPVEDVMSAEDLQELQDSSVGRSWDSYLWDDRHWAAPVDAAAQVSARRADRWAEEVPASWAQVVTRAGERPGEIAVALNPTHLLLTTMTVCHALSERTQTTADLTPAWWSGQDGPPVEETTQALALLRELEPLLHPLSWRADPIELLDLMTSTDEIAYVPAVFGYSSYSRREDVGRPVVCGDVPGGAGGSRGGMLGGVGLAVSARTSDPALVGRLLTMATSEDFQVGECVTSGGQPAHRRAWESSQVDELTPGFFAPTLASLDHAFVRPRVAGWPTYQRDAGVWLHRAWSEGATPEAMTEGLRRLWLELVTSPPV